MSARGFPAAVPSISAARRFIVDALDGNAGDVVGDAQLMTSELATNAVQHAGGAFEITLHRTAAEIRVEVTDHAPGRPTMRAQRPDALGGRGLHIVDQLATDWGVTDGADAGKTVWFTLALMPLAAVGAGPRAVPASTAGSVRG